MAEMSRRKKTERGYTAEPVVQGAERAKSVWRRRAGMYCLLTNLWNKRLIHEVLEM